MEESLTARRSDSEILAEIREILKDAPPPGPRKDPNLEPKPIDSDFFTTKPGFWDEYAKLGRRG
jgi:hypothetical protein